jgi:hypothetical protein
MEEGSLDSETLKSLSKSPFSERAYKIFLDQFWQEEKKCKRHVPLKILKQC